MTPLLCAVNHCNTVTAEKLLSMGANIHAVDHVKSLNTVVLPDLNNYWVIHFIKAGFTALHYCAFYGLTELAISLLTLGANKSKCNKVFSLSSLICVTSF